MMKQTLLLAAVMLSVACVAAGKGPVSLTVSDFLLKKADAASVPVATEFVEASASATETLVDAADEAAAAAEAEEIDEDATDAEETVDTAAEASVDGPAPALVETEANAMFATAASVDYQYPGHAYGPRDDVSGGLGSRKFIAPKGKGCYIELNNCPRHPSVPTNKPFADGWIMKVMGFGWFGPRVAEKRCLARAKDYHQWCYGTQGTTVTATWRPTGKSRSAPNAGCWISQFSCAKHPTYAGKFYDSFDGARSSTNQARCFQRAREFHKWCGNSKSVTTTAEYRPTGRIQDFPADAGCFIYNTACPAHSAGSAPPPQASVGYFRDHWGELNARTGEDEASCFRRAQQYHSWCALPLDEMVVAEYKPTGRTKTYPRNLMAPIQFVEVDAHGKANCLVQNTDTLIVSAEGAEGACQVPFSALRVPRTRSLAGQIISFDVKFLRRPSDSVGRHGGIYFGSNGGGRTGNAVVDWIDRSFDRGYRVYGQTENNKWTELTPNSREPHQHWSIVIMNDGTALFTSGDISWTSKVSVHELSDIKLGFWAWGGNKMKISNFHIRPYQTSYKYVDLIANGKQKGNAEYSAIPHGVEIRSLGGEGAISIPMSAFGLPTSHSLANKRISFDVEFTRGAGSAGRHGGIFFGPGAAGRYNGDASIDWIEAGAARGYRVYWQMTNEKWDYWAPKSARPDQHWEIAIDKKFRLQFTAGDTNWNSRLSAAWNDGFIGFWVYHGVTMRIMNVLVTDLTTDVCSTKPCQNGAGCTADGSDFTCQCGPGFTGADCSIALNRCTPAAIASCNGGKCINGPKKYKCDCAGTGKVGKRCDGHKVGGWFRAGDSSTVVVGEKELIGRSSGSAAVVELQAAAKPGETVTVKATHTDNTHPAAITAWIKYRGDDLVSDASWECSKDAGATWAKATIVGSQGMDGLGTTTNMPPNAKYIWAESGATNAWCRTTLPAAKFASGDRVALALKTTISSFCARSSPASTTTYYGEVCGNGGVRWTHYYTSFAEVREELKGQMQHCAKSRGGSDDAQFFGDCETVPTILADAGLLKTSKASSIAGLQIETNPCAASPCGRKSTCEWSQTGPFPFSCKCADGYSGTGHPWAPCRSVDACASSNPCHHNAKCHKTGAGKFECRCKSGFAGDGKSACHEINPCQQQSGSPCASTATCKHVGPGKAVCSCPDGFTGNGKVCNEVDPCASPVSPCKGQNAKCTKTGPAKFQCSCGAGFVLEENTCHVPDVCHPKPCSPFAKCSINSAGKPVCACKPGFKGDGKVCSGINPCEQAGACGVHAICESKEPGQHTCRCEKGFKGDGKTCAPIDACDAAVSPCSSNAICKATGPGSYSCTCKSGFIGNGHHCKVADACDAKPCSPYATCTTTGPGAHTCTCKSGYSGDGTNCAPIDNCKSKSPCHVQASCRMTGPGTHVCQCNAGYTGSGEHCEEINMCKTNPCVNAQCTNTGPGKYSCACKPGFTTKGSDNPDICVETNNCNAEVSPCNSRQICKVTGPGTHKCECKWGHKKVGSAGSDAGESCVEIDRCAEDKPCSSNAVCQKTGPGTFLCTCNKHFAGDGINCEPVNNCKKQRYPCHADAKCQRTGPGQHTCTCKPGFEGDGTNACVPKDNCVSNPCPVNAVCEKTGPGSHRCTPRPGFAFANADHKAVIEIDNCKASKSPCSVFADCAKTGPGTHKCTCKAGYAGDGSNSKDGCAPVDMCKTGPCDPRAKCRMTGPGTYTCKCRSGHVGDGSKGKCDEINLCSTKNPCDANAECMKTGPGKASCTCKAGWSGNGMKCEEVDNCKIRPSVCSSKANCQKTGPGKHKCTCKPGYKGDGNNCHYDTTELDHHDNTMRDQFSRIDDKLLPAANRVVFNGHDSIQNQQIGVMHDSLKRVDAHVQQLQTNTDRTATSLHHIAKAMKAIHDNTIETHVIHNGPPPLGNPGTTDAATSLKKVGDIADQRIQPQGRDRGVSRIGAN